MRQNASGVYRLVGGKVADVQDAIKKHEDPVRSRLINDSISILQQRKIDVPESLRRGMWEKDNIRDVNSTIRSVAKLADVSARAFHIRPTATRPAGAARPPPEIKVEKTSKLNAGYFAKQVQEVMKHPEIGATTYKMDLGLNIYEQDEKLVSAIDQIVNKMKEDGASGKSYAVIKVVSKYTDGNGKNSYGTKKIKGFTLGEWLRRNHESKFEFISEYSNSNGLQSDSAFSKESTIEASVVRERAGGCSNREHHRVLGTMKITEFKASKNNCFFRCIDPELDMSGRRGSKIVNDIREKYNVKVGEMIPVSVGVQIMEDKKMNAYIYVNETNECHSTSINKEYTDLLVTVKACELEEKFGKEIGVVLVENHYTLITGERIIRYCKECCRKYLNVHNCVESRVRDVKERRTKKIPRRVIRETFNTKDNVMHIDFETYNREDKNIEPYRIGWCFRGKYDKTSDPKEVLNVIVKTAADVKAEGDAKKIELEVRLKDISGNKAKSVEKKRYAIEQRSTLFLCGFNGAKFDFWFLVNAIMYAYPEEKPKLIFSGSAIIQFRWRNLRLFDMAKHVTGSLKECLKAYGCLITKGRFDHKKGCKWDNMKEEDRKACDAYLERDVLSLCELFEKYNDTMMSDFGVNVTSFISTADFSYRYFFSKDSELLAPETPIHLPQTAEESAFYRRAIYGGRTYKNRHNWISKQYESIKEAKTTYKEVEDYIVDADVVSLYPTAMHRFEYPIGVPQKTDQEVKGKPGVYECTYTATTSLLHAVLPRRGLSATEKKQCLEGMRIPSGYCLHEEDNKGGLYWDLKSGYGIYTSVDIEEARRFGYTVNVLGGYYWERSAFIFRDYVVKMFKMKNDNKATKGVKYNLAKLFMNSLYGKMGQRMHLDKGEFVRTNAEFWVFCNKYKIHTIEYFRNGNVWLQGEPREEDERNKCANKPTYLGAFILSYSRKIMREHMQIANPEQKIQDDFMYTDTDSLQMHARQFALLQVGSDMGMMSNDLEGGGKVIRAIWIAPKVYLLEYITKNGDIKYHVRAKGVNLQCDDPFYDEKDHENELRGIKKEHHDHLLKQYENMDEGKCETFGRGFSVAHTGLHPHHGNDHISLQGSTTETRTLNRKKWSGRSFNADGTSVPWGWV